MKTKREFSAKCVLVLLGVALGIECQGLTVLTPVRMQIARLERALTFYAMNHDGKLPPSLGELVEFACNYYDYEDKPLLKKEDLIDPWGATLWVWV